MTCETCAHWKIRAITRYGDGSFIETAKEANGQGRCDVLGITVAADFGCNKYIEGDDHETSVSKSGAPWQNWVMIKCPDCGGGGDGIGSPGHRCAGTGLVRRYDDGYIGDEQTRLHPKEKELGLVRPPTCPACTNTIDLNWKHCPHCGAKTLAPAEPEVINSLSVG